MNWQIWGEHSKIPQCCIDFFTGTWQKIYHTKTGRQYLAERPNDVDYIPCPGCKRANKYIEVHNCDIECWDFLKENNFSNKEAFNVVLSNVLSGKIPLPSGQFIYSYYINKAT